MSTAASLPVDVEPHLPLQASIPSWPSSDGGFGKGTIDLGGLEVRQVSTFANVWSTTQGGAGAGATFSRPSPVPAGFWVLGHYAQRNDRKLFGHVLVARDTTDTAPAILAPPRDYTLVWSSPDAAACFWLPTAPDGYSPIGVVVTATPDKPSLDEVRCVRADFTDACEAEETVWSRDSNGGFSAATLRPAVRRIDARGVHTGTFLARSRNAAPVGTSSTLACLKNNSASYTYTSGAMPDLDQVHAILAAYSPLVYLHPKEPYFPSSVTWFFENGALLRQKNSQTTASVAADGSNLPQGGDNDGKYWLDLPADRKPRDKVKKGDLTGAKAYVQVKPMLSGTATDLAMWFFYPFNGPARARLLGVASWQLGSIGSHVGDWEHLTFRVSNFSGELLRMYFSQHSAGIWVDTPELEYGGGGGGNRPVAYASLNGHVFYPKAGLELQGSSMFGIRNDSAKGGRLVHTGGVGRCEVVSAEYLGIAEPAWLGFMRPWGPTEVYDIGRVINSLKWFPLPRSVRERLDKLVNKLFVGKGATGPKKHGSWVNDKREPN